MASEEQRIENARKWLRAYMEEQRLDTSCLSRRIGLGDAGRTIVSRLLNGSSDCVNPNEVADAVERLQSVVAAALISDDSSSPEDKARCPVFVYALNPTLELGRLEMELNQAESDLAAAAEAFVAKRRELLALVESQRPSAPPAASSPGEDNCPA